MGLIDTAMNELITLIKKLRPVKTQYELMRVGSNQDGGYLIPDDVEDIVACFSPGVEATSTFEKDLFDSFGINSHLADYSVNGPPEYFTPLSFTKKFLGAYNDNVYITLDDWVKQTPEYDSGKDFLLQMDIESSEYATILASSEDVLKRFRTIVMEIHDIDKWAHPAFFYIVNTFFEKLLKNFTVVHLHPNNYGTTVNINGIELPQTIEFTFLRKDRIEFKGYCDTFPDELDFPCAPHKSELVLPNIWYK